MRGFLYKKVHKDHKGKRPLGGSVRGYWEYLVFGFQDDWNAMLYRNQVVMCRTTRTDRIMEVKARIMYVEHPC